MLLIESIRSRKICRVPHDCMQGCENPADCLSRGLTPHQLINHPFWMAGPEWARLAESRWPVEYSSTGVEEEGVMAETNNALLKEQGVFTSVGADNHCLLDLGNRCSSWWKILRIVARVLKFFKLLPRGAEISVTDMNRAELV